MPWANETLADVLRTIELGDTATPAELDAPATKTPPFAAERLLFCAATRAILACAMASA
jgi:hypothetical protein